MFTPQQPNAPARIPPRPQQQQSRRSAMALNCLQQQQGATEFQTGPRKALPAGVQRVPGRDLPRRGKPAGTEPAPETVRAPAGGLRNASEVESYVQEANLNQDA
ncbi:hypothetical protein AAFF27_22990 [Xylophilus sp. GW821-FHT01B05]